MPLSSGLQPHADLARRVDVFEGAKLAVRHMPLAKRRRELDVIADCEHALGLSEIVTPWSRRGS